MKRSLTDKIIPGIIAAVMMIGSMPSAQAESGTINITFTDVAATAGVEAGGVSKAASFLPASAQLIGLAPNPFNPTISISFSLSEAGHIALSLYNLQGQKVLSVVDGYRQTGQHQLTLDASGLPSGVYFLRLEAAGKVQTMKAMLLK